MKNCLEVFWIMAVCFLGTSTFLTASSQEVFESADAVFTFNGNAKSIHGDIEGNERFTGGAGYVPYSFENEHNLVASFNRESSIEFPDLAHLEISRGLTIAIRFRIDGGDCALISQRAEQGRRAFQIGYKAHDGSGILQWVIGEKDFTLDTPEIGVEKWMTGVFIYDPDVSTSIYIDGKEVAHVDQESGTIPPGTYIRHHPDLPWFLGAQPYPSPESLSNHLRGYVDVLAVWSRALSPEEAIQVSEKLKSGL